MLRFITSELKVKKRELGLKLERVPDPARRPEGKAEKFAVKKPSTRYYPGLIVEEARKPFATRSS